MEQNYVNKLDKTGNCNQLHFLEWNFIKMVVIRNSLLNMLFSTKAYLLTK